MTKFKFHHLHVNHLKLADLAGLVDKTLMVVEPQVSLLGDTGTKWTVKLRTDQTDMKSDMDKPRSSLLTGEIKQANAICDATLEDIKRSVKAGSKSTIAAKAPAGELLKHFLNAFWDVDKKPIMSQISMTGELLARYTADTALQQAAQTLSIAELFVALSQQNNTLSELYSQRLAEYAGSTPAASDLRLNVEEDYNAVCDVVLRTVNADPSVDALVTLFNQMDSIRKKYSALLPAKIDLAHAITELIPSQIYTGRAITPIPVLYYDGQELVFARDFSVTYKNNVEVGEATVIMHGKGKFTGKHIRKFNIIKG